MQLLSSFECSLIPLFLLRCFSVFGSGFISFRFVAVYCSSPVKQENKEARQVLAGALGMPEGMKALKEQVLTKLEQNTSAGGSCSCSSSSVVPSPYPIAARRCSVLSKRCNTKLQPRFQIIATLTQASPLILRSTPSHPARSSPSLALLYRLVCVGSR